VFTILVTLWQAGSDIGISVIVLVFTAIIAWLLYRENHLDWTVLDCTVLDCTGGGSWGELNLYRCNINCLEAWIKNSFLIDYR